MTVVAFSFSIIAVVRSQFYEFTGYLAWKPFRQCLALSIDRPGYRRMHRLKNFNLTVATRSRWSSSEPVRFLQSFLVDFAFLLLLVEFCCFQFPCGCLIINIICFLAWVYRGLTFLVLANSTY
jgi:hypothetical protein